MDLDLHRPGTVGREVTVDNSGGNTTLITEYPLPTEILELEQQDPTRCPILINNDNDDLDSPFGAGNYPQDNDDEVLQLRNPSPINNPKHYDDDDVVMVTLRKFNGVNAGKIRLTTSKDEDVRFFKYEEAQYTLNAVDMADLEVNLSNPGTTSPLKDLPNEDVSFYLEGINANDDLTVQMIFEDDNGNELARQEVHIEIIKPRLIHLSAQGNGELTASEVQDTLSRLIQGANVVRGDRDWLDADADVMVPVTFRLGQYFGRDTDPSHESWEYMDSDSDDSLELRDYMNNINGEEPLNIYLVREVFDKGGYAWRSSKRMVLELFNVNSHSNICAHEWLHAFAGDDLEEADSAYTDDGNHLCLDGHLMVGADCSGTQPGSDVREIEKVFFEQYSEPDE